ncbi:putative dodecenoyl-CoA isomerase DCI1 KNAG_0M00960 [Huiozyma naganishii CBS 8797]|uniref:Uncharacterized protein n=1 Tax=Huiozyma naganishii (strain ATCC MYA-139 / BCRC 22969 / CBS 8797 / KCTC 17520 / NBRC 10181 / NCYC 3082 / Yp74L-3) TaxID=1071383 RepID=J7SAQ6_HUIN7|nr:hypothetical protein KNAG_0M00960 [Kazachstania naganishii CBS 8797]CCK72949.1 hypothetical protein KNAG_0M00960 [Kazachstania naganishii CBS 8797]
MSERLSYMRKSNFLVISIHDPAHLNSLMMEDFLQIAMWLNETNDDPGLALTVIQSTGDFFSAGGKFESVLDNEARIASEGGSAPLAKLYQYISAIAPPNLYFTQAFQAHKRPIVCCLNGPAFGFAASVVMLCDVLFTRDNSHGYIMFPFTRLGFVAEGGTSVTLYEKLGVNATNEALFFSERVSFQQLQDSGCIAREYRDCSTTEEFNRRVLGDLSTIIEPLSHRSMKLSKQLIASDIRQKMAAAQSHETLSTLPFWVDGEPGRRFATLAKQRSRKDARL